MQAQILLTLAASSLKPLLVRAQKPLTLMDIPAFASEELQLRGLTVPSDMLAGLRPVQLDQFRDLADKAHCPCLLLVESQALDFQDPARRAATVERMRKLAAAASRLGCSCLGVACAGVTDDASFDRTAAGVKESLIALDRFEVNVLLRPGAGPLADPVRLTDLIKKVGGFRIGSLPSFEHAHATGDLEQSLRRLAPYAGAIIASVKGFKRTGEHEGYDLVRCVEAVRSVGYLNTLSIEYTGKGDPVKALERARELMSTAIMAEEAA
ncbi:MAG: TIM barrel protein [Phycisphaerales bacterium]